MNGPSTLCRAVCVRCLRPLATCLCALVRPTAHRTEVLVLQHPQEQRQAKNSVALLRLSLAQLLYLPDMGDHPLRRQLEVARLLVQLAGEQGEEAGLAAAVGAGDADLLADMQAEIDAFEQRPPGPGEGELA